jgi:KDO2-lipid IV(A) lauroyltransferase
MAKPRSHVVDYCVYLLIQAFVCLCQALPPSLAWGLGRLIGRVTHRIDRRHRQTADENLRHSLPHLSEKERAAVVVKMFEHFGQMIAEIVLMPRLLHVCNWRQTIDFTNVECTVGALLSGRPLLIVTGHFGNWELAGFALNLLGFRTHAIARTLDNPYVDRLLRKYREKSGQRLLAKKGDFDQMQEVLDVGGVMATLADQDAGSRGVFVDFFGRPASTHKAIALMAIHHRVPILVAGAARIEDGFKYRVIAEELILPEEFDGRPDAVKALTQRYTSALERLIRRYPEQYFWLHRRWKHQPPVRKSKAA